MSASIQAKLEEIRRLQAQVEELTEGLFDEGTEYYVKVRITEEGYDPDDDTVNVELTGDRQNDFWTDAADLIPVEQVEARRSTPPAEATVCAGMEPALKGSASMNVRVRDLEAGDEVLVTLKARVSSMHRGNAEIQLERDSDGDEVLYALAADKYVARKNR